MTSADERDVFAAQVAAALDEVVAALAGDYGVAVQAIGPGLSAPAEFNVVSEIGCGRDLVGALTFGAPGAFLDATAPGCDPSAWLVELANQVLGRLKNRLWRSAICLELGTPALMAPPSSTPDLAQRYVTPCGEVRAWFAYQRAPGVEWRPPEDPQQVGVVPEGDLVMF